MDLVTKIYLISFISNLGVLAVLGLVAITIILIIRMYVKYSEGRDFIQKQYKTPLLVLFISCTLLQILLPDTSTMYKMLVVNEVGTVENGKHIVDYIIEKVKEVK